MTVAVFNDRFSPNVGDGLLAACLERELRRALAGETVDTIDVDGKTAFPSPDSGDVSGSSAARQLMMRLMPPALRSELAAARAHRRLRHAVSKIGRPRAFVIGGGHLINGSGTYFPLRLRALTRIARDRGVPLFVQSVGVTDPATWNAAASRWLKEAFDDNPSLRFVSVRDQLSARYWVQGFPRSPRPVICPDPGLLTRKTFGVLPTGRGKTTRIGVGVTSRRVTGRLSTGPHAIHATRRFYLELCRSLVRRGSMPYLFTNGDPEDHAELELVFESVGQDDELRSIVRKCDRPADAAGLVGTIAQFHGLVAHRMHATIAAYSLGIPAVGLAWDRKLESFFRRVKRERYFIADPAVAPEVVAERIEEASRTGISEGERRKAVGEAEEGVRTLAERLRHLEEPAA